MSRNSSLLFDQKPVMNYVRASIKLFYLGVKKVNIKARGRAISRAVNVIEIIRKKKITDKVSKITIKTEKLKNSKASGISTAVSTIEINLNL